MNSAAMQEYSQHVEDFRRTYLMRVLLLIAGVAWPIGMLIFFLDQEAPTLALLLGIEGLCWLTYRLYRGRTVWLARQLFVAGLLIWWLGVLWITREPVLLFAGVLITPLAVAVLEPPLALLFIMLTLGGQIGSAGQLAPDQWSNWRLLLAPFLTLMITALALLRNLNLDKVLYWALHSTRAALDRLEEVQEHRGQLQKSMQQLDAANERLERANEMLVQARAEAEAARHARNQFAVTVSHELRTPLGFVIGFSELMVNSPRTYGDPADWPPGLYEDICEIYHSSSHLMRLVNDILDLGRAEARRLILFKEWTAPQAIIDEAVGIMRVAVSERKLALEVNVDDHLPELFVDRTRVRQVLINLISNSLRFTEHGGITVSAAPKADGVLFCVRDTGIGIPAEEIPKVFENFGQANATVWRRRGGSGLGVPISRRFVEMHGGKMWLESEVGVGTSFFFSLPLPAVAAEMASEAPPQEDEFWAFAVWHAKAPRLVMLLSREPNAVELMDSYVKPFRLIAIEQPLLAHEQILKLFPQALIVDQRMVAEPEVQTLIRTLPYDLPVLTIRLPGSSVTAIELPPGVRDYLLKPVLRQALVRAIKELRTEVRSLLVVDDDPAMSRLVTLTLMAAAEDGPASGAPIQLSAVHNGQTALEYLRGCGEGRDLPDAILLDLGLPDISGWDVLAALQANPDWRAIPVILVTAAGLPEELDSRERNLLELSTSRPLTQEELTGALSGLLQAIRPKFPVRADVPTPPTDPSA
jgi:signal transduction histidine kinase/CheY-like chemotaxis protein